MDGARGPVDPRLEATWSPVASGSPTTSPPGAEASARRTDSAGSDQTGPVLDLDGRLGRDTDGQRSVYEGASEKRPMSRRVFRVTGPETSSRGRLSRSEADSSNQNTFTVHIPGVVPCRRTYPSYYRVRTRTSGWRTCSLDRRERDSHDRTRALFKHQVIFQPILLQQTKTGNNSLISS